MLRIWYLDNLFCSVSFNSKVNIYIVRFVHVNECSLGIEKEWSYIIVHLVIFMALRVKSEETNEWERETIGVPGNEWLLVTGCAKREGGDSLVLVTIEGEICAFRRLEWVKLGKQDEERRMSRETPTALFRAKACWADYMVVQCLCTLNPCLV